MASKSKSGLSETSKASPASPRVSKLGRGVTKSEHGSPSPLQSSRLSIDRSPRSITSKPTLDRRSPKVATPPDKPQTRVGKGSELQAQLSQLQEDLKKAKNQIDLIEKEKVKTLDELREAQNNCEEANEKLREALVAQKRAEENSEIEKFRVVELEQAGIDAAHKKEDEWQKELAFVKNQHALDMASLLASNQEVERLKQELSVISDAKNQALIHAENATKVAEVHAEKVEILSSELARLKALLDLKHEKEVSENIQTSELKAEINVLKQELEIARNFEERFNEREASIEQLVVDLEAAKMAGSYAQNLVAECKAKIEELEMQTEEASKQERTVSESLSNAMKQLERKNDLLRNVESELEALKEKVGLLEMQKEEVNSRERTISLSLSNVAKQLERKNDLLHNAESELEAQKEKVGSLEMAIRRHKEDLEKAERRADLDKEVTDKMEKMIDSLKTELETVREEKEQASNNEKLASSNVQTLLEEKNTILNELENSLKEEEKSKKAMESLASALHEISAEARESKDKLLSSQVDCDNYETQIDNMKLTAKTTKEKYESMLQDANHEIDLLKLTIEQSENSFQTSKAEWGRKEFHYTSRIRTSEEENSILEEEIDRLVSLVEEAEEKSRLAKEDGNETKNNLKEAETEVICLQGTLRETKAETVKLKERLMDNETELQSVIQENKELQAREAASIKKVEELSKLLEEALTSKKPEENGELTDSEKDYDMLPKVVEFSEQNGHGKGEEKPEMELPLQNARESGHEKSLEESNIPTNEAGDVSPTQSEDATGKLKEDGNEEKDDDAVEVEFKMWESCTIEKKEASPEREPTKEPAIKETVASEAEVYDENTDKIHSPENIDEGESSLRKQVHQKKKNALLRKFGNILKKKSSSNQK